MDARLFWLALGAFAIGAEGFVISSLLPAIGADTGVSLAQGGYLVLAFALAYALGGPFLASFSGHRDRRVVLGASLLVFALGNVVAALAHSYTQLLAARILMALAAGLYAATAQATAVAISPPHHRARAISMVVGGSTVAVAIGAPLGALLAEIAGWRGTFWAVAGVSAVATLAIVTMLPGGLRGPRLPLRERLAVIARPGMMPILLTTLLPMTGAFAVFTYIAPLATRGFGLGEALLPAILLAFGLGAVAGNITGGQLADRFGGERTTAGAAVLMTGLMAGLPLLLRLPANLLGSGFLLFMFAWGVIGWAIAPAQASRVVKLAPDAAPLALSLNASALYLGVAAGAAVGGGVVTYGAPIELGWAAAGFAALTLAVMALTRPEPALSAARLG